MHSRTISKTKHGTPPVIRYLQSLAESRIKCLILWSICRTKQTEAAANSLWLSHHNCRLLPNGSILQQLVGQAGKQTAGLETIRSLQKHYLENSDFPWRLVSITTCKPSSTARLQDCRRSGHLVVSFFPLGMVN